MPLTEKTTISQLKIPQEVLDRDTLKFIVLIDNVTLVEIADDLAQGTDFAKLREVVWVKNPDLNALKMQIAGLGGGCKACSISTINKLAYTIVNQPLDEVEVDSAFVEAGRIKYNQ